MTVRAARSRRHLASHSSRPRGGGQSDARRARLAGAKPEVVATFIGKGVPMLVRRTPRHRGRGAPRARPADLRALLRRGVRRERSLSRARRADALRLRPPLACVTNKARAITRERSEPSSPPFSTFWCAATRCRAEPDPMPSSLASGSPSRRKAALHRRLGEHVVAARAAGCPVVRALRPTRDVRGHLGLRPPRRRSRRSCSASRGSARRMASAGLAVRRVDQLFEDAAVGDAMAALALGASAASCFSSFERSTLRLHARQMCPHRVFTSSHDTVRVASSIRRRISASGMSSERQWRTWRRSRSSSISAVPRRRCRGIEEALALVEPHRLHVHTRFAGKFANSHKVTLTLWPGFSGGTTTCCHVPPPPSGISYRRCCRIALAANVLMRHQSPRQYGPILRACCRCRRFSRRLTTALSSAPALGGAWSPGRLLKGMAMSVYGIAVLGYAAWRAWLGVPPEAITMGVVGMLCTRGQLRGRHASLPLS